jgi:hypothetical protein
MFPKLLRSLLEFLVYEIYVYYYLKSITEKRRCLMFWPIKDNEHTHKYCKISLHTANKHGDEENYWD